MARRQRGRLSHVRQLRQHHRYDQRAAPGVRVGAGQERQSFSLDHPSRPRQGRHRSAPPGVLGRDGGAWARGLLVPAAAGAEPPGRGRVPDAQRLELDAGEHMRRRARHQLAILRGPADQLPVPVQGMGSRHGDRHRRPARRRRRPYH
ncbi:hypothetical protein VPH35_102271 [Triticum aestivum]